MALRSFKDPDAELFFKKGVRARKKGWDSARGIVMRKLDMLHYAKDLKDLRAPPNNRLESLKGNLEGLYSIRINDQWRIVFGWDHEPYDLRIMDYH
jgi:proteic killer suppression protein